ncbi:thiol:disulfide interchange protein DsbG [Rheinheimera salexigens]|uniref:Thiol:disulfide interchange protein n=1 Tax=Rheinheimera salexigens TaxID=1628148 RepID=A0A1E7Q7P2_9GAMM|nr:thiol:disulfide interchange protein DsbG [Rheinheimera salexigens]OEY70189.1 protein-disulfide isomerase [Rheinheimera salexigens]
MKFSRHIAIIGLSAALSSFAYAEQKTPEVITFLQQQGVEVVDTFKTDAGVTGYAVTINGRALSVYLTPDNKHAMIGNLIDAQGNDLGAEAIQRLITGPANDKAWQRLADSNWVADGKDTAPRIIYTFTDPNCPYCHKLREAAAAEIAAGTVQLRHIMVGIIRQDSPSQAANILGAANPAQTLLQHHTMLGKGGIKQDQKAIKNGNAAVNANTQMLQELGYSATPTSFYKDENGEVVSVQGLPRPEALNKMLGK